MCIYLKISPKDKLGLVLCILEGVQAKELVFVFLGGGWGTLQLFSVHFVLLFWSSYTDIGLCLLAVLNNLSGGENDIPVHIYFKINNITILSAGYTDKLQGLPA